MPTTHILLLRGINVGRNNRIGMGPLRELLEGLGYTGVRTLLNSGNAVVTARATSPATVARAVERAIRETFGLDIRVVVRSREQVERVIAGNPLPDAVSEPKVFHVGFCEPAPPAAALDGIDAAALAPEQVALEGDTLYAYFAAGMQNSPLNKALEKALKGTTVTLRNWNTVNKLLDLAEAEN